MRTLKALTFLACLSCIVACGDAADTGPSGEQPEVPPKDMTEVAVTDTGPDADDVKDLTGDVITYEDDCGDGLICILGECLERSKSTSCLAFGQCCEEDSDDCLFGEDGCFCDADCVEAGDCCPDACAACGFCNEDGNAVAPSCTECVAKDCGDCAGCQDAVSSCDDPGEDCSQADILAGPRCGEDENGHLIEVCTPLKGCWRWLVETYCQDLNFCTQVPDVCADGACVADGDPNDACDTPDDPCMLAICEPGSGDCTEEAAPLQAPCDDGSLCSINEACFNGDCIGNDIGPIEGAKSTDYFTESEVYYFDLTGVESGTTDEIEGYACEDQGADYDGSEFSFEVSHTFAFTDVSILVSLELEDSEAAGTEHVDLVVLSKIPGTCWPDACIFGGLMGDDGRLEIALPVEEAEQTWTLVADGRKGYEGRVRLTVSYYDIPAVESFCGNGEDDDGDGNVDCEDLDCFESDHCGVETACSDGADNDLDGFEDCFDVDCAADAFCLPEQDCEGEADTDGDGLTGCDDPDCNGVGDCGAVIECADAIALACFETLEGQTLADGFDTFTGVAIPACGDSGKETYTAHKQLVYHVELPAGCTGFSPVIAGSYAPIAHAFGPDCSENSCNASGFASFPGGTGGAVFDSSLTEAWIVVGSPDSDSPAVAALPFDITLDCICQ